MKIGPSLELSDRELPSPDPGPGIVSTVPYQSVPSSKQGKAGGQFSKPSQVNSRSQPPPPVSQSTHQYLLHQYLLHRKDQRPADALFSAVLRILNALPS